QAKNQPGLLLAKDAKFIEALQRAARNFFIVERVFGFTGTELETADRMLKEIREQGVEIKSPPGAPGTPWGKIVPAFAATLLSTAAIASAGEIAAQVLSNNYFIPLAIVAAILGGLASYLLVSKHMKIKKAAALSILAGGIIFGSALLTRFGEAIQEAPAPAPTAVSVQAPAAPSPLPKEIVQRPVMTQTGPLLIEELKSMSIAERRDLLYGQIERAIDIVGNNLGRDERLRVERLTQSLTTIELGGSLHLDRKGGPIQMDPIRVEEFIRLHRIRVQHGKSISSEFYEEIVCLNKWLDDITAKLRKTDNNPEAVKTLSDIAEIRSYINSGAAAPSRDKIAGFIRNKMSENGLLAYIIGIQHLIECGIPEFDLIKLESDPEHPRINALQVGMWWWDKWNGKGRLAIMERARLLAVSAQLPSYIDVRAFVEEAEPPYNFLVEAKIALRSGKTDRAEAMLARARERQKRFDFWLTDSRFSQLSPELSRSFRAAADKTEGEIKAQSRAKKVPSAPKAPTTPSKWKTVPKVILLTVGAGLIYSLVSEKEATADIIGSVPQTMQSTGVSDVIFIAVLVITALIVFKYRSQIWAARRKILGWTVIPILKEFLQGPLYVIIIGFTLPLMMIPIFLVMLMLGNYIGIAAIPVAALLFVPYFKLLGAIDRLRLKIGKVSYKDYSARQGTPRVMEYNINLDEEYTNITNPYTLVSLIVVKAL
ncbi:MAG: hypothetical protein ABH885_02515, partial [Candidatus Omnitrophota bacterium]